MMYDLILIGKGIASSTAIISLLNSGKRIAVIAPAVEKGTESGFKIGETLSPSANKELQELGVYTDFLKEGHLKAFSSFSSWGKNGQLSEKYVWEAREQAGWYIDRLKFEDFLWQKALKTNFDYIDDKLITADFKNQVWIVKTKGGNRYQSNYILDCSGRAAVVLRNFSNRKRLDKLVAIYSVLDQYSHKIEPTIASLVEPTENGWFYSSLTPSKKLIIAYFTDSDLISIQLTKNLETWKQLIATSSGYTSKRIQSAKFEITQLPFTTDAATIISYKPNTDTLLGAGDAVASFDPLSSHGMTTALWSGRKAAEAFLSLINGSRVQLENYNKALNAGIDSYLIEKQQIYAAESRFMNHLFWKRRQ